MRRLLLLILFSPFVFLAQESEIDSLTVNFITEKALQLRQDGYYPEGLKLCDDLLENLNLAKNPLFYAQTLHVKSRIEIDLGDYNAAISNAKNALALYSQLNKQHQVAAMNNIIGVGFYFKSQMDSTLVYYNKSYNIKKKIEQDPVQLAISVFNIGIVYEGQGAYDDAIESYLEAEALIANRDDAKFASDLYVALSNSYRGKNNLVKSKEYAQLALTKALDTYGPDNPSVSFVYQCNAGLYKALGDHTKAKPFLQKALEMRIKFYGPSHRWTVESYRSLSETYQRLHQLDSALIFINKAISISKAEGYQLDLANNYVEKVDVLIERKQWSECIPLIAESRLLYQKVFGPQHKYIAETFLQEAKVFEALEKPLEVEKRLSDLYVSANYQQKNLSLLNAPFLVLEALKLDFSLAPTSEKKKNLLEEQMALINHIKNFYHTPEAKLFFNTTTTAIIREGVSFCYEEYIQNENNLFAEKAFELVQLNNNSILAQERQVVNNFQDSNLAQEGFKKVQLLRQKWGNTGEQLYYEETASEPNEKVKDSLIIQRAILSNELDIAIKDFQKIVGGTSKELRVSSLKEVQAIVEEDTQVIQYFSGADAFFAFLITTENVKFVKLGSRKETEVQIGMLREGILNRTNLDDSGHNLFNSLLFPVLDGTKDKLVFLPDGKLAYVPFEILTNAKGELLINDYSISYQSAVSLLSWERGLPSKFSVNWSGLGLLYEGQEKLSKGIEEIETIAKLTGGKQFLNNEATKERFFKQAAESRVLHLAAHGNVNFENPLYSELKLYDESITASQIYNANVKSELVVLSACETGYGSLLQGEGVMSLSRAFTYAGAKSTVMSLWPVPDQQTSKLMIGFYEHLENGKAKDEALQLAKLDYLEATRGTQLQHPYYWAGFVVSGKVSVLENKNFILQYSYIIIIGLSILLIIYFILLRHRRT